MITSASALHIRSSSPGIVMLYSERGTNRVEGTYILAWRDMCFDF